MIVTNSLLDEGSSTDESEVFVPRPGDGSASDEDWGVLSINGSEHSGELILDGEESHEEFFREDKAEDGSQLSLPGADSVPTVVGSIEGLPAEVISNKEDLVEEDDSTENVTATDAGVQKTSIEHQPTAVPKSRLAFLLVPALLLVPTIASICLYNERNSLQMSVMELEDMVSSLRLEAEQRKLEEELLWEDKEFLQLSSQELQARVASLKREADRKQKKEQDQLDTLQKERSTLKLYMLHLQDLVNSLEKKAAKEKREGDVLFQDKKCLEWSASTLQQKIKDLQMDAEKKKGDDKLRLAAHDNEKSSLQKLVAKAQDEVSRVQKEADRKLREEELRWNSLFQEKISLRVSTARLEEQVLKLKRKAKHLRREELMRLGSLQKENDALMVNVSNLEEEISALKREAAKRTKQAHDFLNLNSCGAGDTILADNCWVNAKANIQLGGCANEAKDVVKHTFHDFSESLSHWMDSAAQAYAAKNSSDDSVSKMFRNVDYLGQKLWNATTTKSTGWNATSTKTQADVGVSVAKMIRKVDYFGRALWNSTAFKLRKSTTSGTNHNKQERSFFSRMDLNGKLWFESFFAPSSSRNGCRASKHASGLDRIFQKVSDVILAAGSPDQILEGASAIFVATSKNSSVVEGEAFMTMALEKLCSAMAFNQTSKKYLMEVAQNAFEEVSLTHSASM